jgi:Flp pilus assembly protein TadG
MIARFSARRMKHTEGATLVEFSLVALMLVIMLLAVVEMARMALVYSALANAARFGARYASVHGHGRAGGAGADGESGPGANPAQVLTVVKNVASSGLVHLSDSNISVTYSPSNKPGSIVTVTVAYTYDPLMLYFATSLNARLGSTSQGVITF